MKNFPFNNLGLESDEKANVCFSIASDCHFRQAMLNIF